MVGGNGFGSSGRQVRWDGRGVCCCVRQGLPAEEADTEGC